METLLIAVHTSNTALLSAVAALHPSTLHPSRASQPVHAPGASQPVHASLSAPHPDGGDGMLAGGSHGGDGVIASGGSDGARMMNAPGGSHPGGRIIAGASHPDGTARRIIAVPCGADAGEGAASAFRSTAGGTSHPDPRTVAHPGGQASVDGGASQPVHASHPAEVSQPAGGASQASAVLLSQPAAHRGSLATWSGNANGLAPSAFIPATPARPAPLGAFSRE
ncbi:hypothetical protein T484DRAFT_1845770, partial [Baffinella frigidus]